MDGIQFDNLARTLARCRPTRRAVLKVLGGGIVGTLTGMERRGRGAAAPCRGAGKPCDEVTPCCGALVCVGGVCAAPGSGTGAGCAAGQTRCGGGCADLQTDPANCGACGVACPTGQVCAAGDCVCGNGGPICGAAGEICCEPGQGCEGGACCGTLRRPCAAGRACCGDQLICLVTASDPQGTCLGTRGAPCAGEADCLPGHGCCGGVCTSLSFDPNCSACGVSCPAGQTCRFGECVIASGEPCPAECAPFSNCEGCQFEICDPDGRCN